MLFKKGDHSFKGIAMLKSCRAIDEPQPCVLSSRNSPSCV